MVQKIIDEIGDRYWSCSSRRGIPQKAVLTVLSLSGSLMSLVLLFVLSLLKAEMSEQGLVCSLFIQVSISSWKQCWRMWSKLADTEQLDFPTGKPAYCLLRTSDYLISLTLGWDSILGVLFLMYRSSAILLWCSWLQSCEKTFLLTLSFCCLWISFFELARQEPRSIDWVELLWYTFLCIWEWHYIA